MQEAAANQHRRHVCRSMAGTPPQYTVPKMAFDLLLLRTQQQRDEHAVLKGKAASPFPAQARLHARGNSTLLFSRQAECWS